MLRVVLECTNTSKVYSNLCVHPISSSMSTMAPNEMLLKPLHCPLELLIWPNNVTVSSQLLTVYSPNIADTCKCPPASLNVLSWGETYSIDSGHFFFIKHISLLICFTFYLLSPSHKACRYHAVASSSRGIAEKTSCLAAAGLAGNFFSCGHITGSHHAATPCFLLQPGSSVSSCDLVMIFDNLSVTSGSLCQNEEIILR